MCGLVLLITKNQNGFNQQQQNVFNSLLYLSGGFRGRDGTGVVAIDNIGNVKLAKAAMPVDTFLCQPEMNALERSAFKNGWAMIGHNRSATKGSITDENSHPFWLDDNIVMVHNGTFNGDHKKIKDTEVDSEVICHLLNEHENPEEALRKVNAAYALIWYNVKTKSIHVVRNDARPLCYVETSDSYIFASDISFLNFAIDKFQLKPVNPPYEIASYDMAIYTLDKQKNTEIDIKTLDCSYWKHNTYTAPQSEWSPQSANPFPRRVGQTYSQAYGSDTTSANNSIYREIFEKVVISMRDKITPVTHEKFKAIMDDYPKNRVVPIKLLDFIEGSDYPTRNSFEDFIVIAKTLDDNEVLVSYKVYNKKMEDMYKMIQDNDIFVIQHQGVVWRRYEPLFPVDDNTPLDTWEGIPMIHGYLPSKVPLLENSNAH